MRGLVCLGLVLAACHDRGVVILVDPPANVTVAHVRLYLGTGDHTDAPYLQTAASAATAPANARVDQVTYWSRDPNNELDVVDVAPGKTAGFTLVSTGQSSIPIIIAIGYDAQWTPVATAVKEDVTIPANDFTGYHLALHAPVSPLLDAMSPRQLALWSPAATPAQDAACAGLVLDTGDQRVFVVTDGDEDCDGLAKDDPLECDPDAYLGTRPATRGELSCLAPGAVPTGCYLGGATCTDGVPRDTTTCEPTKYCAPTAACTVCGPSLDCTTDVSTRPITSYHCQVHTQVDGTVCSGDRLVIRRPPTGGFDCTGVAIRDLVDKRFNDQAQVGSLDLTVQLDESCHITMQPSGSFQMATPSRGALLAIDLENGHGLGIPVTFVPGASGCDNQDLECTPDTPVYEPEVTACMAAWDAPTPVVLALAGAADALDPTLPGDESELYYVAGGDIFVAKRDPQTGAWMPGTAVTELDTPESESAPHISPDGQTMLFVSGRVQPPTVYVSERNPDGTWGVPIAGVPAMPGVVFDAASADETGTHVVFSINKTNTVFALEEVLVTATGPMSLGTVQLPAAFATANNTRPYLTPDGLHLYFTSDAVPPNGDLSTELYVVSRNTIDDTFRDPVLLRELGGPTHETSPWVARDGHTMYFASSRTGASRIYRATR